MTEIEIIFAANDSGLTIYGMGKDTAKFLLHLQAFAALVAAHEREECAKVWGGGVSKAKPLCLPISQSPPPIWPQPAPRTTSWPSVVGAD